MDTERCGDGVAETQTYYQANRERLIAASRAYRAAHREHCQAYNKEWRVKNLERVRDYNWQYRAADREATAKKREALAAEMDKRAASAPARRREYTVLYYRTHCDRIKQRSRDAYRTNKEHRQEVQRRYVSLHPERAQAANRKHKALKRSVAINDFTSDQWIDMVREYNHACGYCRRRDVPLTMDHMTPLARGGQPHG